MASPDAEELAVGQAFASVVAPVHVLAYGPHGYEERRLADLDELEQLRDEFPVVWVNLDLDDRPRIEDLATRFGLHPLSVEDALSAEDRPKLDVFDTYLFLVVNEFHISARFDVEHVSLFLGDGWLVTVQEFPGDPWDPVRERIRNGARGLTERGADRLAHALVDTLVDSYAPILDRLGGRLDELEDRILEDPTQDARAELHTMKRELLQIWRSLAAQREALTGLYRLEDERIARETRTFLRDVVDHMSQALDLAESYRERANDVRDMYIAEVNTRLAEVMKVLTILSTIFIPLTFIASVYGMNFEVMPEMRWRWSYPLVLASMAILAALMVAGFRRRGWI